MENLKPEVRTHYFLIMPATKAQIQQIYDEINGYVSMFNIKILQMLDIAINLNQQLEIRKTQTQLIIRADPMAILDKLIESKVITPLIVTQIMKRDEAFFLETFTAPKDNWNLVINDLRALWKNSINEETKVLLWDIITVMTGKYISYFEAQERLVEAKKP